MSAWHGNLADLKGAREAPFPASPQKPQLATLSKEPPTGSQWSHEIKYDGYRMLCHVDGGAARFFSRNAKDWTDRLQPLVTVAAELDVEQVVLDGEIVVLQENGTTSFQALQNALKGGTEPIEYFVFDLVYLDGYALHRVSLEQRKELLAVLFQVHTGPSLLHYCDHIVGQGAEVYRHAALLGAEGIVSKRLDRAYRPGRQNDWLKTKCVQREEFIVVGYTQASGSRSGFGALLVGYYDSDGDLQYAGRVGTGFSEKLLDELYQRMQPLRLDKSPLVEKRPSGIPGQVCWTEPELVAQVEYTQWTDEGRLRHPSFQGLREDAEPRDIVH